MEPSAENNSWTPKSVLVIDDDAIVLNQISHFLKSRGISEIVCVADGEAAWNELQSRSFDCLVLDWKLPKVGGLTLFNRIRRLPQYATLPILVVSGFLQQYDFKLLQEFPCTRLLEKPFSREKFMVALERICQERIWNEENALAIQEVLQGQGDDGGTLVKKIKKHLATAPNAIPLAMIAARSLVASGDDANAELVLKLILALDDDCVMAMNELAKIHFRRGDHERARDILTKANQLSMQNIGRLCLLGEVEMHLNEPAKAKEAFSKALQIDEDDKVAKAGKTVAENLSSAVSMFGAEHVTHSFASTLNSIAISLVKTGRFAQGIEQYKSAMAFLRMPEDSAKLAFNLGLGYLRWGKPEMALPWFQESASVGKGLFAKGLDYLQRLSEEVRSASAGQMEVNQAHLIQGLASANAGGGVMLQADDETFRMGTPYTMGQGGAKAAPPAAMSFEEVYDDDDAASSAGGAPAQSGPNLLMAQGDQEEDELIAF